MTTLTIPDGMPQYSEEPRLDVERIRQDFPIFGRSVNGYPLIYLDSANTSQKPQAVIEAMAAHYALRQRRAVGAHPRDRVDRGL
jgi:cysteine desulfurase/selenocysteine lyase